MWLVEEGEDHRSVEEGVIQLEEEEVIQLVEVGEDQVVQEAVRQ